MVFFHSQQIYVNGKGKSNLTIKLFKIRKPFRTAELREFYLQVIFYSHTGLFLPLKFPLFVILCHLFYTCSSPYLSYPIDILTDIPRQV